MRCLILLTIAALVLACVASSPTSDDACTDHEPPQSQLGSSLLQARRQSVISQARKSVLNPSGAAAPLDETGYAAVADRCCQAEMKVFVERQVLDMGMEVCEPAGLTGIVPYHSCEMGVQTFAALTSNLLADSEKECKWLATTGNCKPLSPSCTQQFAGVAPLADCGCSLSKAVLLDFENANLIHNNLAGKGPDTGVPSEMRYGGIGEYPTGQPFDLVITANDFEGQPQNNGKNPNGKFGRLAIHGSGNPAGWSGEVKLQLSFVRPSSSTPVVLPEFFFAVFDVDATTGLHSKQTLSGKGYKGYVTDVDTDLLASKNADGSTQFTATKADVPNPTDPLTATKQQRGSMAMYFYDNRSSFEFTLGVQSDGTEADPTKWFLFAGKTALSDRCGP